MFRVLGLRGVEPQRNSKSRHSPHAAFASCRHVQPSAVEARATSQTTYLYGFPAISIYLFCSLVPQNFILGIMRSHMIGGRQRGRRQTRDFPVQICCESVLIDEWAQGLGLGVWDLGSASAHCLCGIVVFLFLCLWCRLAVTGRCLGCEHAVDV